MFDPIIDFLQDMGPELKLLVSAIVTILGIVFVVRPIGKAFAAFSNSEWMKGLMWLIAAIVIVALSVGIIAIIYGLGEDQGESMEQKLSYDTQPTKYEQRI